MFKTGPSSLSIDMIDPETFDRGIRDLYRTAESDGVFCYTFFKAVAVRGVTDDTFFSRPSAFPMIRPGHEQ